MLIRPCLHSQRFHWSNIQFLAHGFPKTSQGACIAVLRSLSVIIYSWCVSTNDYRTAHTHTCTHTYMYIVHTHTHTHTHTHAHTLKHAHTHTNMHTHTHTHTHTNKQTYTHTHTQIFSIFNHAMLIHAGYNIYIAYTYICTAHVISSQLHVFL